MHEHSIAMTATGGGSAYRSDTQLPENMKQEDTQQASGPHLTNSQQFIALDETADIFVVLLSYNTAGLLNRCIDSLRAASQGLRISVVIVDNASRDNSVAVLKQNFTDCTIIENKVNVGFGRANNQVLTFCNAPFVLLLNSDAFMAPNVVHESLVHMAKHPDCGVLGARLVDEDGNGDASARDLPNAWTKFALQTGLLRKRRGDLARAQGADFIDCDWVTGCYYLVRQAVIDDVGLFDPRYFLYYEEVDHCKTARQAGWKVHCLIKCNVVHVGGASARTIGELTSNGLQLANLQIESELLYFRKHDGLKGLLLALSLALATDAVLGVKCLLRGQGLRAFRGHGRHAWQLCRIAYATRGGLRPTL